MASRTVLNFETDADVWQIAGNWAKTQGFQIIEQGHRKQGETTLGTWRRYSRNEASVEISQEGKRIHLEAWIDGWAGEMNIENRIWGWSARWSARKRVNDLLRRLGQRNI